MKTHIKQNIFSLAFFGILFLLIHHDSNAQLVSGNGFLQGTYAEVGVSPSGSFGTTVGVPNATYHPRPGSQLGFVSDPQKNGWSTGTPNYIGDYFIPGRPEEGWGISINNTNYNNMQLMGNFDIPGGLSNYVSTAQEKSITWQGNISGLSITARTYLPVNSLYFVTEVTVVNTSASTINNVFYMRNVDPDQEQPLTSNFSTTNSVVYQNSNTCNRALVSATGLTYGAYLGLGSIDSRARVSRGSFSNRSASRIWNGIGVSQSGTATGDFAISIAFNLGNLAPNQSTTFSYAYILSVDDLNNALAATNINFNINGFSYSTGAAANICSGTATPISIVNPGTFTNWTWSPSTGLNTTSGISVVSTLVSPITYTATGTGPCGSVELNITINPVISPTVGNAGPMTGPSSVLLGQNNVNYSISPVANATQYVWTLPPGAVVTSGANTNSITFNASNISWCGDIVVTPSNNCSTGSSSSKFTCLGNELTCSILSSSFCVGQSFDVTYTSGGIFNNGNVFTAQLSDANGNFGAPVSIGSVTSTAFNGTIPATIPMGTLSGTGYRIRVVSSNLTGVGSTNGSDIAINNYVTPTISLTATSTTICSSSNGAFSVDLTNEGNAPSITWFVNGQSIAQGTDTSIEIPNLENNDEVYAVLNSNVACPTINSVNSNVLVMNVLALPTITCPANITVSNDTGQCGANVSFAATATGTPTPELSYSTASGSFFPVGTTTTVTATATNSCGTPNCSFTVTVNDTQAPNVITQNVTATLDANGIAQVTAAQVNNGSTDNCDIANVSLSQTSFTCADITSSLSNCNIDANYIDSATNANSGPNGQTFTALATGYLSKIDVISFNSLQLRVRTYVSDDLLTAFTGSILATSNSVDGAANYPGYTSFTFASPPLLTAGTQYIFEAVGSGVAYHHIPGGYAGGTAVSPTNPTSVRDIPFKTYICPAGVLVTLTVTDVNNNSNTGTAFVSVVDNSPPTITCPANITVSNTIGQCGANVTFSATATDNCGTATLSYSPASGSFFVKGTTTVTATANDGHGNTTSCTFTVTVNDTEAPTIACPANITASNTLGQCGANVTFAAVASDNCGTATLSYSPASGSFFAVGTTTVTATANDGNGNTSSCTFTVTVNDAEAPTIACPANITVSNTANQCGANANFAATASDNCGTANITYSPASGSFFAVGTTTVTATANDGNGNTSSCAFTVTVNDTQPPSITCAAPITVQCPSDVVLTPPTVIDNCSTLGNALKFDGANDYFDGNNSALPNGNSPFTVEAWIKPSGSQNGTIFDWGTFSTNTRSSLLYINQKIYFSGQGNDLIGLTTCPPGTWYHFAITFDGSNMKLYVNGVLEVSATKSLGTTGSYFKSGRGINSGGQEPFNGSIDEIRVWNVTRTPAQLIASMNNELNPQSNLVALFHLNQGTANGNNAGLTTAIDDTGSSNNGTLNNFALSGTNSNWVDGNSTISSLIVTNNAPTTFAYGSNTVTWTATDASGNSASCDQTITVADTQAPQFTNNSNANSYIFSTLTGVGLEDLSTGSTTIFGANLDDLATTVVMPFTFNYLGVNFTNLGISTNGILLPNGNSSLFVNVTNNITNAIFTFWDDLYTGPTGSVNTKVVGTSPNRKFIVEWKENLFNSNRTQPYTITLQAWLFESSNVIQYVYGNNTGVGQNFSGTIGLKGSAANDFNEVTTAHTNSTTTINDNYNIWPGAGRSYLFTPSISCAGTIEADASPNSCSTAVTFALNATDNCGTATITYNPASGSQFSVGITTVTATADDGHGNTTQCAFTVTVNDTQPPVINCPGNIDVDMDAGSCGAVVTFAATASDNCGTATITYSPASGSFFTVGTTTVTATADDGHGNTTSCTFTVTVDLLDHVNLQWPPNATICPGGTFTAYGQVYEPNVTTVNGQQGANIEVQFGYNSSNTDPSTWSNWAPATFHQFGGGPNNDEYFYNFSSNVPGTYYYTFRYRQNGCTWQYGGFQQWDGGTWDGSNYVSGVLTVQSLDWANLQWPPNATICQGSSMTAYGQVYEAGVTTVGGAQGAGIDVQFGYSTTNTNPSGWSNWSTASFNQFGGGSANDEYYYNFTPPSSGTYYYTFRYRLNGCLWQYGGYTSIGGYFWDGTNSVSGSVNVNPTTVGGAVSGGTSICPGETSALLTLSGHTGSILRWESSVFPFLSWDPIANNSTSYTSGPLAETTQFRAVLQSGVCLQENSATTTVIVYLTYPFYADNDDDGYGAGSSVLLCSDDANNAPEGYSVDGTDCDDTLADRHETFPFFVDADGDGYGAEGSTAVQLCAVDGNTPPVANYSVNDDDCNDLVFAINPSVVEIPFDNIDNNCNGSLYDGHPLIVVHVLSPSCGGINHGLNNTINCTEIYLGEGYVIGYRFKVTNLSTGQVDYVDTVQHHFKLTDTDIYAYGTSYSIQVAAIVNGEVQGYNGSTCTLTTTNVATTKVVNSQCGSTLLFMNSTINANSVNSAISYRFRVARADAPTIYYYTGERNLPNFNLTMLTVPVGFLTYDTEYKVDVQIKIKLANIIAWSQFGQVCSIFTPVPPTSSIVASQCELVASSYTQVINATPYAGATVYRFLLTHYDEFGDLDYEQYQDSPIPSFTLSMFTGLLPNTAYNVAVSMQLYGTFVPYDKDCSITTPPAAKAVETIAFKATAYPNPYTNNFMIDVKTADAALIDIKVYDMVGRLVEQRTVKVSDLENAPIGDRYPSGVYNVIVSQGENVQTVRVVRR